MGNCQFLIGRNNSNSYLGIRCGNNFFLAANLDKCHLEDIFESGMPEEETMAVTAIDHEARNDAIQALVALGYSATEATQAVRNTEVTPDMTVEDILKQSLKNL